MTQAMRGLFVVGTDTGVGKTRVAAGVARALTQQGRRVGVLKPAATGARRVGETWHSDDAASLRDAIGANVSIETIAPLLYEEPLAPNVAARRLGATLTWEIVSGAVESALEFWSNRAEVMVVEGIGGWLCPLSEGTTVADLAVRLDYPIVVVARTGLGTLNHTLLTIEAARSRALRIAGLVLNQAEPPTGSVAEATNAEELARRLPGIAILGELSYDPTGMLPDPLASVDWYERSGLPRLRSEP